MRADRRDDRAGILRRAGGEEARARRLHESQSAEGVQRGASVDVDRRHTVDAISADDRKGRTDVGRGAWSAAAALAKQARGTGKGGKLTRVGAKRATRL